MINTLLSDPKDLIIAPQHCEPHAIIISPTRELTLQIFNEARKFSHGSVVKAVVAYGGVAVYHQVQQVMVSLYMKVEYVGK
jgi:probable ATP-dependent RNA helicase DDX4